MPLTMLAVSWKRQSFCCRWCCENGPPRGAALTPLRYCSPLRSTPPYLKTGIDAIHPFKSQKSPQCFQNCILHISRLCHCKKAALLLGVDGGHFTPLHSILFPQLFFISQTRMSIIPSIAAAISEAFSGAESTFDRWLTHAPRHKIFCPYSANG